MPRHLFLSHVTPQQGKQQPARLLRESCLRFPALLCILAVEGAAKSLISMTPFNSRQATNQGVVGSIPASRANQINGLREKSRSPLFFSAGRETIRDTGLLALASPPV